MTGAASPPGPTHFPARSFTRSAAYRDQQYTSLARATRGLPTSILSRHFAVVLDVIGKRRIRIVDRHQDLGDGPTGPLRILTFGRNPMRIQGPGNHHRPVSRRPPKQNLGTHVSTF